MKLISSRTFLYAFMLLFCAYSYSQETITITLLVDTDNFDPENLSKSCTLTAVYSKSGKVIESNGDLESFTIDAYVDDEIIWVGKSTGSKEEIIDIRRIKRENDSKVFDSRRIYGKSDGITANKIARSTILFDTENKEAFKYEIHFEIASWRDSYKIDPKIKVGSMMSRSED